MKSKEMKEMKKVTIELNGIDADKVSEMFYNFHNNFKGSVDYQNDKIVIWKTDPSADLTKSKEIGLSIFLNECKRPEIVTYQLEEVLRRIIHILKSY